MNGGLTGVNTASILSSALERQVIALERWAGNDDVRTESGPVVGEARELLRSLTAVRGAATMLESDRESLSAAQHSQLVSVVAEESAHAMAIVRRAIARSHDEGGGVDGMLGRLVVPSEPNVGA